MRVILLCILLSFISCKKTEADKNVESDKVSEPTQKEVPVLKDSVVSQVGPKDFRELRVLDSKYLKNTELWNSLDGEMSNFSQADHDRLKPLIFDQDIPTIQQHIINSELSYEDLTKFYLFRIRKYDRENTLSLNSVISLNPNVIAEARELDEKLSTDKNSEGNEQLKYSIHGMPILLKDNINAEGMATTAGSAILKDNFASDAFITAQLKGRGALILGKANLSEWAYFFCGDCPSGYSAIGGQTLNPYGRRIFDTGGSSSGSGVAVAANLCVAAIGSETSGSILSPSSQNSVVGLKPTIGLVSRSGIIPISSTLDTAGPMTKNVVDNAILLSEIYGEDKADEKSIWSLWDRELYFNDLEADNLIGKRFGAIRRLMKDTLYLNALNTLRSKGAIIVEIEPDRKERKGFISLLNLDMRNDLPVYLDKYAGASVTIRSIQDIIDFNSLDSINAAPYGQRLFRGIVADEGNAQTLDSIKTNLHKIGKEFFDVPTKEYELDAILSINNYHAGYAAVAEYPAITVPMGYDQDGKPKGLTFIAERLREKQLLEWAYGYEQASLMRKSPPNYN